MKILFLIPYGSFIACGAVRVLQYLPYLEHKGYKCQVINYHHSFSIKLLKLEESITCRSQVIKRALLFASRFVRGYFNRFYGYYVAWKVAESASNFDVVFSQRVLLSEKTARRIKDVGAKLIFDFDDAIFLDCPDPVATMVHASSAVISGSHYTHEYASLHNSNAVLIPSSVPIDHYDLTRREADVRSASVKVGWIGSSFTLQYLEPIYAPLKELQAEGYDIELVIAGTWGATEHLKQAEGLKVVEIPFYTAEDLPAIVKQIDIGVMPLSDTPWEKGKCAMKALLYMAGAKPVVCSPVGEVLHIVEDGTNGYVAATAAEWKEKLKLLVADSQLRDKVGRCGRLTVETGYSTATCFNRLEEVIEALSFKGR